MSLTFTRAIANVEFKTTLV